jgi:hypothetical protein
MKRRRAPTEISWLGRAESERGDFDARFILLWIAFNAGYAKEFGLAETERDRPAEFLRSLLAVADKRRSQKALTQLTGPIRTLLDDKFVFEPFWKALREHDSSARWGRKVCNQQEGRVGIRHGR